MGAGASTQEMPKTAEEALAAGFSQEQIDRYSRRRRVADAVMGALVANAASMPTQWFYDLEKLKEYVGEEELLFFPKPSCFFFHDGTRTQEEHDKINEYHGATIAKAPSLAEASFPGHYALGETCPMGELLMGMIEVVATFPPNALVNGNDVAKKYFAWQKTYTGRQSYSMKEFAKNMAGPNEDIVDEAEKATALAKMSYPDCGADNTMTENFAKVVACTLRFSELPLELYLQNLEILIRFQQNSADSKAVLTGLFLGRMMYKLLEGATIKDAFEESAALCTDEVTTKAVEFVRANVATPTFEALDAYGVLMHGEAKAILGHCCMNPHGFVRVLLVVLKADLDFAGAVRENILACGGNCEAAIMVGALLAAASGVPDDLAAKFTRAAEARALIAQAMPSSSPEVIAVASSETAASTAPVTLLQTAETSTALPSEKPLPPAGVASTAEAIKPTPDSSAGVAADAADPPVQLKVGDKVRALFAGKGHWYPATVSALNADGTFSLDYADGDFEDDAKREHIQKKT